MTLEGTMYEPSRQFLSCHVAGFSHWYGLELSGDMKPGDKLELQAEPDNPYDPNAVAVLYKGTKIGYVPADENGVISQLLYFGHGEMFSAIISSVRLDQHPENMVHMIVYVTDARKAAGAGDPVF